jgi:hypothetical protein
LKQTLNCQINNELCLNWSGHDKGRITYKCKWHQKVVLEWPTPQN